MDFKKFQLAVQRQFNDMKTMSIFRSQISKDLLWETYLSSFPEGTNPIYKERTEHDCNCCKQFIRAVGDMVAIDNHGVLRSIWDVTVGGEYQVVANALSAKSKSFPIENIFLHTEHSVGTESTRDMDGTKVITWNHFYIQLPNALVCKGLDIGTKLSDSRSTYDVMARSLKEITIDAIDTVLELISQNSLYRGEEQKFAVSEFLKLKKDFDKKNTNTMQEIFIWGNINKFPASVSRIRNTAIGTLLVDLSEGKSLEDAVKSFEFKVAPTNYKRPTALVTKSMIDSAKKKIEELGFMTALDRRYAVIEDITINNILFADHSTKQVMGSVFDELSSNKPINLKSFDKVEEIHIDKFLSDVLPKIDSIEALFENKHQNNLVSLIAPNDLTAKGMFKWDNNFSWSYAGEVADSMMKERVKAAGGKVDGVLRFSIQWSGENNDNSDLDAHCKEPTGHIYYADKKVFSGGNLDIDITQPKSNGKGKIAVENITWPIKNRMEDGVYKMYVNQFRAEGSKGFTAEVEFDGQIYSYAYDRPVKGDIQVAEVTLKKGEFTIKHLLPCTESAGGPSRQIWNIPSMVFNKVNIIMMSPNYWDEKASGNKHYFFMIENCLNDGKARGFYNEFLSAELDTHRKVLEIVGSKMMTEESSRQLSGLGFSSTKRSELICKVSGKFTRTIKIIF